MSNADLDINQKDLKIDEKIESEVEKVERDIDTLSKVSFLDSLLDKQTEIRNMLDMRSNIVIGFNSAIIVIVAAYFREDLTNNPVLWVLLVILITSLFLAIIALKPPHYQTDKGQAESLFYHHYIESKDMEEYRAEIHKALRDESQIFDAYITEVYNLTKYSNIPRKFYLYASLRVLIYGLVIVLAVYAVLFLLGVQNSLV